MHVRFTIRGSRARHNQTALKVKETFKTKSKFSIGSLLTLSQAYVIYSGQNKRHTFLFCPLTTNSHKNNWAHKDNMPFYSRHMFA